MLSEVEYQKRKFIRNMSRVENVNLFKIATDNRPLDADSTKINQLCTEISTYLEPHQVEEVYRAFLLGAKAHKGQSRMSGEPYICHPVEVALILSQMRMDMSSIVAAILHDVIEDTTTEKTQLADQFGSEVAELVDGVSKLANLDFQSRAEAHAENFRKMMLAMVKDIRVIIIKLADRLHNMRTLDAMPPDKRRRIAKETMDIYAPIANRLGIFKIRHELLDLSIRSAFPMRFRALESVCKKVAGSRKKIFNTIEKTIKDRLKEANISTSIKYRQKNIHSIYRKMKEKKLSFKELTDVFGVRIMTDSEDDCYRVLGVVHNLYKPLPGRFKDYLAIPKTNGYQSLHSSLFGPHGIPIEVQIRTKEMNHFAESGFPSTKSINKGEYSANTAQNRALEWLKNLLEMQQKSGSSQEFLESVKIDLFPDEIYVFTPKGDIKKLPRDSTVVDFAYAVHTDVGNTCVAARVDKRMLPLSSKLYNGQAIEIISSDTSRPHPNWLDFVITAKARTHIRHFLKSLQTAEAVSLGLRLLQQSIIHIVGCDLPITQKRMDRVLIQYSMTNQNELMAQIGLGNRNSNLVAKAMYDLEDDDSTAFDESGKPLAIKGTEGMVVSFSKCCRPVPGDAIIGQMSTGKGIVVHQQRCRNMTESSTDNRHVSVQWSEQVEGEYLAFLRIDVANQRGVLADLATTIANSSSNIEHVNLTEKDGRISTIEFVVVVTDRIHLARIIKKLRLLPIVIRIVRK